MDLNPLTLILDWGLMPMISIENRPTRITMAAPIPTMDVAIGYCYQTGCRCKNCGPKSFVGGVMIKDSSVIAWNKSKTIHTTILSREN